MSKIILRVGGIYQLENGDTIMIIGIHQRYMQDKEYYSYGRDYDLQEYGGLTPILTMYSWDENGKGLDDTPDIVREVE